MQAINQSRKQAAVTAEVVYQARLYGKNNSFSYLNIGTEETVSKLTLEDVKKFYADYYSPRTAKLVAVSDQSLPVLKKALSVFDKWDGTKATVAELNPFPELGKTKIYLVDKPGAAQSEIRIGKRGLPFDGDGEYYRASLMNFVLGGAFNSRINLNLREDKGYTYGARSSFSGSRDYGAFTAAAAIRTDATADGIVQIENEIRGYAESGITESELSFTRKALGQNDARLFETPAQKLGFLANILIYDLNEDFVDRQSRILAGIGKSELDALARKHLVMDDMIIVVVGDKRVIRPEIEKLGYEIVEVDESGDAI